jgi:hypothetical protein
MNTIQMNSIQKNVIVLNTIQKNVIVLNTIQINVFSAKCLSVGQCFDECHSDEFHLAKCQFLLCNSYECHSKE